MHLVYWLFQNDWTAIGKRDVRHPAGYIQRRYARPRSRRSSHPPAAVALGVVHFVIDTRVPLRWWAKVVVQPQEGVIAEVLHIWRDQASAPRSPRPH